MHAMTEFHPEDFRESIDDMCDAAIRRMYAIQEGGPVHVYTQELGSLGLVSLMLERDHAWSLNYTSQRRTALIRW